MKKRPGKFEKFITFVLAIPIAFVLIALTVIFRSAIFPLLRFCARRTFNALTR